MQAHDSGPRTADGSLLHTDTMPPSMVHWGLQPALLVATYLAATGALPYMNVYGVLLVSLVVLTAAERRWPARTEWVQSGSEWGQVAVMFLISGTAIFTIETVSSLAAPDLFAPMQMIGGTLIPTSWPYAVQVLIAFSIIQFMAYWLHRWQHEIGILWRTFGHGTHHSYTKLSAINWNTAHPFEAVLLVLPATVLGVVFARPDLAITAGTLVMVVSACAHANLRLNERWIGRVLTTNSQHMRHHSSVFAESQTNYGCAMTFWDRVFGTFSDGNTSALGDPMDGERTLWRRLTVPLRR